MKGIYEEHKDFDSTTFWGTLTRESEFNPKNAPNGLIQMLPYLLLHKFLCHAVFAKNEGNKCSRKELFMLWCVHANKKVSTTYHIFQSLMKVATHRNTTIGMGHVVTGLALHFGLDAYLDTLTPLELELFTVDSLIRAEILESQRFGLRDPNNRSCAKYRRPQAPRSPRADNPSESSGDEAEAGESASASVGWQQVLTTLEANNQRLEQRLTTMDGRIQ